MNADEIANSKQHIANLEDKLEQAINECTVSVQTIASLEEALKIAADELALSEAKSNALAAAKLVADIEIQALQAECKSSSESICAMKSHIVDLELKQTKNDDCIRSLTAAKMATDARAKDLETTAEKAKDAMAVLHQRIVDLEAQGVRSGDQRNALTNQLEDTISAKTAADARIIVLESRCEKDALQIATMEANAVSLLAEINKTKEALLSAQKEMLQLKDVIAAKEIELASNQEASATCYQAKEAELVAVNDRLSEASIARLAAEQEVEALKIQRQNDREEHKSLNKRIVDLEGILKQTSEEKTAISQQFKNATALSAAAEIAAAKETDDLKTQSKKIQDELSALQQREHELEAELNSARNQLLALATNHKNLTTSSAEEIAAMKCLVTELETKATVDSKKIAAWTHKCHEVTLINEAERHRIVQLEGQITAGTKDYAALKSEFDALEAALAAADVRIAQLTERGRNDASALDALQAQIVECKAAIAVNEKCKADLEVKLLTSDGEISALTMKVQVSADESSALKQLVDSCQMELETLNARTASLEAQKLKGEEQIATLTQQLADCNKKLLTQTDTASQRIGVLEGQCEKYEADMRLLGNQLEDQKAATASANEEYQSIKESSAAAMVVLETKGKADDATIASLRAQGKVDSKNIASLTDQLTSLTNELQAFKSDAKQTIAALQDKGKNDTKAIGNLHAQNAANGETIASLTQQLADANHREKVLAQESRMENESSAAVISDLKLKGKRDGDEIEALKRQLAALQASSTTTITDLQALLKKSDDELAALGIKHANLITAKAAADQQIEVVRKQVAEGTISHDAELSRVQQELANVESVLKSLQVEHLTSDAKNAENCIRQEATVEAQRTRIAELERMLNAASQQGVLAAAAATVSSSTSSLQLPPPGHQPASSHSHAIYEDGFQPFDSEPIVITDLSAFNTDPGQDPETVLRMLIKIKMEYALVCSELDRARNEISRVKRISLINAQPIELLRRKATGTSEAKKAPRGETTADASSAHKPGGSSSFSSDMLKSTADLLRIKAKSQRRNGSGSVTGSMAGSMVSFSASLFGGLGGGSRTNTSVRGSQDGDLDHDNWEISSQTSAVSTAKASLPPVPRFISTPK